MRALPLPLVICVALGGACGESSTLAPDAAPDAPLVPTANLAREVLDTDLAVDLTARTATATVTFGASDTPGATLEIGDLTIERVTAAGADVAFAAAMGKLDLALAPSTAPTTVEIAYRYLDHAGFEGINLTLGFTFAWPYFCGNMFPCHSDPADGTTFSLALTGVPAGKTAIFPAEIPADAPSYQVAWSLDAYTELPLGTTAAGTQVSMWYRPNEQQTAERGGANLVAVFDWLERTIGPYRFGPKVGTVSVKWPPGAFGGMEHHPLWHVSASSLASEETNAHEAAHGWYGDGIRIACWEDFVLSEGTVTYLAGRALEVVAPQVGAQVWQGYAQELAGIPGTAPVWPQSCGSVDILEDNLYQNAPYIRGAFFYRALAAKVGADQVDQVLATFYAAHAGKAATMQDMLDTIQQETGYDPTACADMWLRSTTKPAANTACP